MSDEQRAIRQQSLDELVAVNSQFIAQRDQGVKDRTEAIIKAWKDGATQSQISDATGLTKGRVSQLITEYMKSFRADAS